MKNASINADGSGKAPPQDRVERTLEFAGRMIKLGEKRDGHPGIGRVMLRRIYF